MCSYERAGRLGSRDLSFSDRDLGKRAARKSKFLYFAMFASFLEFRARTRTQDLCPFFDLRNRAEISHMNPRRNIGIKEGSV